MIDGKFHRHLGGYQMACMTTLDGEPAAVTFRTACLVRGGLRSDSLWSMTATVSPYPDGTPTLAVVHRVSGGTILDMGPTKKRATEGVFRLAKDGFEAIDSTTARRCVTDGTH